VRKFGLLLIIHLFLLERVVAQSPNATINGLVLDPVGAAISGADVLVVNDVTGVQYATKSNGEGIYVVSNLPPGSYRIQVSNKGFKTIIKPDIVIHVQDALAINFTLPVGAVSEIVTISVGAPLINTSNASVSTVVDRQFVENMPLNGRSFHDLILLTPGVLTNTPQVSANNGNTGEFSVNGQRTESNYYTVDGVSANLGVPAGLVQNAGNSGSLPASTTLGTTQGLVSVDALEEFRVQTSTYSAEYGRNPGGQFSFVTRSGSNQWHGTAFDYLRNTIFDANDWFNNFFRRTKSPEHQNDFGGTLGGPVQIPGLYKGRDRTFFFFSYEGLRLLQPQAASVTDVPTVALRQSAPGPLQSLLNAFPLPSCPSSATNCATDLGNGFGQFVGTWSNPSSLDSYSLRLDEALSERLRLFFRFSATPSTVSTRNGSVDADPSAPVSVSARSETYTLGVTSQIATRSSNEFRFNHSSFEAGNLTQLDHFGGAVPFEALQVQGLDSSRPFYTVFTIVYAANFSTSAALTQYHSQGLQRQWNIVDTLATNFGRHLIKVGVDYRHLSPVQQYSDPSLFYEFAGPAAVQGNTPAFASAQSRFPAYPRFMNFSAFAEDEWRATGRLNLSVGLRWEVNPAPGAPTGNLPYTFQGDIGNPSGLMLARQGTPLWRTSWYNFAPRLGTAYVLHTDSRFQTVVRVGGGVFFDTGQQLGTSGYNGAGFSGTALYCSVPQFCAGPATFPLTPAQVFPPIPSPPVGPGLLVYGFAPHLQLPFTLQWNTSVSQAIGESQALTVSYVGANGRRLLQSNELDNLKGPAIGTLIYGKNGLTSDYDALQVQFQRRMSHGLQGLASYTWGHSIDYGSRNVALPYQRGNSDFDVRHSFSAALSYDLPHSSRNRVARVVLEGWALDDRFTARTGFPVTLNGNQSVNPVTLQTYNAGLDLVPNQPLYISGSQCVSVYGNPCPGGWAINRNAFTNPPIDPNTGLPTRAGNAPRNFVRGFGAWQMDLAVRRDFSIHNSLKLQFRAEAFDLFNHPNFGTINSEYCSPGPFCTFGESTATLARSLGGLSPLYQIGGPRSMQFAIKLMF
jgi:hypothetical protein